MIIPLLNHSYVIFTVYHHLCQGLFTFSLNLYLLFTEPNLKLRVQVQLKNFQGLDEAGIDGGGIFREFMSELVKTAFDPNRGFFKYTNDKLLYPCPQAKMLVEDYRKHYFFLGRILGKVS